MAENFVPQVDYTSRDYVAIRNDLLNLIPTFVPEWTNRDPADFGIALVELFAYMGDLTNFYIDRSANEAFITTASQRENVLELAKLLSYVPTDITSSTVTLTFQNSTASPITVPALTQVATNTVANGRTRQVIFETDEAVTVPAKVGSVNGSATVTATQGITTTNENVGQSDGSAGQIFQLGSQNVIRNSIEVTIGGVTYSNVPYLIDYDIFDPVFSSFTDAEGTTYIQFGDDVSGRIPPANTVIYATYRTGDGEDGNVSSGTIKYILTNLVSGLSVNNQDILVTGDGAATGGADIESTDSIRINAPQSLRALNRAVSIADYARIALQVDGVLKTNARADVYTSVTVYMRPSGDRGVASDNVTVTSAFNTLATTVRNFFVDKVPANTTITLQPPSYVEVDIIMDITVSPNKKQSIVKADVNAVLTTLLEIDNVTFEDTLSPQDIYSALQVVDGLAKANIVLMTRTSNVSTLTITNKALTSNVATLTTSAAHGLAVGDRVLVTGVDDTFNGTFVVSGIPTTTTFTYALTAANVSSTSASGGATRVVVEDIDCNINEIPEVGNITVNAVGGIVG